VPVNEGSKPAADHHSLWLGGLQVTWDAPEEGSAQVRLQGDLDNLTVPVFQEVLQALYEARCFVVRLDLAGLEFIDSSGLGAVVGAWRYCQARQGRVTASSPSVAVRRLMDMTGISGFLLTA
jgi:anti-anti-sigma factor